MSPGIDHSANSQRQPHINNTITQLWILALSQPFNLVITHWENANSVIANMSLLLTVEAGGSRTTKGSSYRCQVPSAAPQCPVPGQGHQDVLWGCGHACVGQGEEQGRQGQDMHRDEPAVVTHSRGWGRAGLWGAGGAKGVGQSLSSDRSAEASEKTCRQLIWGFLNFFSIYSGFY